MGARPLAAQVPEKERKHREKVGSETGDPGSVRAGALVGPFSAAAPLKPSLALHYHSQPLFYRLCRTPTILHVHGSIHTDIEQAGIKMQQGARHTQACLSRRPP